MGNGGLVSKGGRKDGTLPIGRACKISTKRAKLDPIAEFREDQRKLSDGLLEIIGSLQAKNVVKAREVLGGQLLPQREGWLGKNRLKFE